MKNIKIYVYMVMFLLMVCGFQHISHATNGKIYLSNNKEMIEKEEEIEITLSIENAKTVAFTAYLYFDNTKLEYISGPENINVVENRMIFVWYDNTGGSQPKEGELAKFKFKAKEGGIANFHIDGEFYNSESELIVSDFEGLQIQIGRESIQLQSDVMEEQVDNMELANTNLETLAIENSLLNPPFDNVVTHYQVEVPNDMISLNVLAVPENENATVQIIGNQDLREGNNMIKIIVTAQDGFSNKIYDINSYRRSLEEEQVFEEEQVKNQEKLEQIYQAEKISYSLEKQPEQNRRQSENKEKPQEKYIILILVIVFSICGGILVVKIRKN